MKEKKVLSQMIVDFFGSPMTSIFIEKDVVGHISKIIFCREDDISLCVSNNMVDLFERLEEGCLEVEFCEKPRAGVYCKQIFLGKGSQVDLESLKFLMYEKNGNSKPSGFSFKFREERERNFIAPGAAPFTLVFLSKLYLESKASEYDLSEYDEKPMHQGKGDGKR